MSKNLLQITLGGQQRTLRFNMGALVHLNRNTGTDPLAQADKSTIEIGLEDLSRIVYAGLLAEQDSTGVIYADTQEQVLRWCFELDFEDTELIKDTFANAYKPKKTEASPEGSANTQ